jgi:hypothetical protein
VSGPLVTKLPESISTQDAAAVLLQGLTALSQATVVVANQIKQGTHLGRCFFGVVWHNFCTAASMQPLWLLQPRSSKVRALVAVPSGHGAQYVLDCQCLDAVTSHAPLPVASQYVYCLLSARLCAIFHFCPGSCAHLIMHMYSLLSQTPHPSGTPASYHCDSKSLNRHKHMQAAAGSRYSSDQAVQGPGHVGGAVMCCR